MSEFMKEVEGPVGLFAIFSEDEGAGYFCSYRLETHTVLAQVRVYVCSEKLSVRESDVQVMWSSDRTKCGVAIFGRMRAVLDISNERELCLPFEDRKSPAITDPKWLEGFGDYIDLDLFIRARQRYWKEIVKEHEPTAQPLPQEQTPIETNFIIYARGPNKTFAVFEDYAETGYLYLYSSAEQTVVRFLHVYDGSDKLNVASGDVQVMWAADKSKCGVAIWGTMRGIIDLASGQEGRVWLESRDTPGIDDQKWLEGF
jgi:hypothetical protein